MDSTSDLIAPETSPAPRRSVGLGSIVLLLGIVMVAVVFGLALVRRGQTRPTSGPAPDFTLTTLDGAQIHLADMKGKIVVINFWASWCGPCRQEAPALQAVWQQYKDQGVEIVGIVYNDTEANVRNFIAEYQQTYPNGPDIGNKIADLYHIEAVPETFIVDRDGKIADYMIVPLTQKTLTDAVQRVLGNGA